MMTVLQINRPAHLLRVVQPRHVQTNKHTAETMKHVLRPKSHKILQCGTFLQDYRILCFGA